MSVNLTWRSFKDAAPLRQQVIKLESGGTIGRADDNQFVVHDPQKFASRYHARLFIHQGAWYIEDTSSAGTFINNDIELYKGQTHLVNHGDILSIGECEIELQIEQQTQQNPTQTVAGHQWPNQPINQQAMSGSTFNIEDFFSDSPPQQQNQQDNEPNSIAPPNIPYTNISDAIDSEFNSTTNKDIPSDDEAKTVNHDPEIQPNSDDTVALRAFLSELNLDPSELIGQNKIEVMRVAGVILRTLTQGMMEVLQARQSVKTHFQMDTTQIQRARNNPLKFSADPNEAMAKMLKQDEAYMDPIESATEAINDAKAHQMAMLSGLDAAIQTTIASFDPQKLEKEFQQEMGFTLSKSAKYWQHFHQKFKHIADEAESTSNNQFSQQFRYQYEEQVRQFYAAKFDS